MAKALRKKPEDMVNIVEDLMKLLENLEQTYRRGRHADPRSAKQTAALLRALADELELGNGSRFRSAVSRDRAWSARESSPRSTTNSQATTSAAMVNRPSFAH